MKKTLLLIAASLSIVGCASYAVYAPTNAEILSNLKASFAERGPAKLDRLDQTSLQAMCSQAAESGKDLAKVDRERLEASILASIPYPADGKYIGDWKEGEKIAQNGRGLQFSDAVGAANGANCYACHQLTPQEISFGNQGPSLLKYGVIRGVKDPTAKDSEAIVKYTWARIWNGHAFNACNGMPRFGDAGILTPAQIKDVMALLLDPASPLNQ
jgi:L-cysteine S-thiosulfotransferase